MAPGFWQTMISIAEVRKRYYSEIESCKSRPIEQKFQLFCVAARHRGAQWLSGRVLDSRPKGRGFEPHRRHCVVSLSKNINPSLVLVQPMKTRPFITERLLMGRKETNQTNKQTKQPGIADEVVNTERSMALNLIKGLFK